MDKWKFYNITHHEHLICNPTSEEKIVRLVDLLNLPPKAQVVDIACGKGEFLIRLAERYDIRGTGIDISPYHIADAERKRNDRLPSADITFTQMNGMDFKPAKAHSLELASCIGASWVFGGHAKTLDVLSTMVKPGGWVVVGEPYWLQEPAEELLEAFECTKEDIGSHFSNAEAGNQLGIELVHTIVSSKDDWDRYEGLQWLASTEYAHTHPDDPDLEEMMMCVKKKKAAYLRWGRDTLGWAIYVFRTGDTTNPTTE